MVKSARTLTTMVVVALWSWSCGSTAPEATREVAAIVVSPSTSTIPVDAQLPLQALVRDESGALVSEADITWTVQNPDIVSVSAAGVVKALAVGTSQVAANALGKSGIAVITVSAAPQSPATPGGDSPNTGSPGAVATVTVTAPSDKLMEGATMQLTAVAKDDKGIVIPSLSFAWSSSNTDKATVSATGVVTGKRSGDVTITAQATSSGGKSGSVQLEVKKR